MTDIENWQELRKKFSEHFEHAEVTESKLRYEKPGEFLEIRRNGSAEAGMPLHGNEIEEVKSVEFRDSEVKIVAENSTYIFRR